MKSFKVLVLALLMGCEGCAVATQRYIDPTAIKVIVAVMPVDSAHPNTTVLAFTDCDTITDVPYVVIDKAHAQTDTTTYILAHEWRHVTQLLYHKSGSCKKAMREYNTNKWTKLQWEMEAECAALIAQDDGLYKQRFLKRAGIYHLREGFPKLTMEELLEKFTLTCEKERMLRRP